MRFIDFLSRVTAAGQRSLGIRRGQHLFNLLDMYAPHMATKISGTENDPFYSEHRIPKFMEWLRQNWECVHSTIIVFERNGEDIEVFVGGGLKNSEGDLDIRVTEITDLDGKPFHVTEEERQTAWDCLYDSWCTRNK